MEMNVLLSAVEQNIWVIWSEARQWWVKGSKEMLVAGEEIIEDNALTIQAKAPQLLAWKIQRIPWVCAPLKGAPCVSPNLCPKGQGSWSQPNINLLEIGALLHCAGGYIRGKSNVNLGVTQHSDNKQ